MPEDDNDLEDTYSQVLERRGVDGIEEELQRQNYRSSVLLTPESISNKPSEFRLKAHGFTNHWSEHLLRDVIMISLFSVFGVLTRIGLSLLFGPLHANVTSKTGALFYDLPPNAVGSFFMGLLVGGKTYIPKQSAPTVYLSLTTGYMGSITTFASWNQQAVEMFAQGKGVAALFELVIGLEISYFSFMMGLHTELALKQFGREYLALVTNPFNPLQVSRRIAAENGNTDAIQNNSDVHEGESSYSVQMGNRSASRRQTNHSSENNSSSISFYISRASLEKHLDDIQRRLDRRRANRSSHRRSSISDDVLGQAAYELSSIIERIGRKTAHDEPYDRERKGNGQMSSENEYSPPTENKQQTTYTSQKTTTDEAEQRFSNKLILVFGSLTFALVYAAFIVAAVIDSDETRRSYWFSCIFGPFGAVSRWQLARLNRNIVWFPKGTFITNMIASAFDAAFAAILLYRKTYWSFIILHGLSLGFCGDMSTVSTFVGEMYTIEKLRHKYLYSLISVVVGQTMGLLIYGISYWVR
eukprot:jgi/Galph1/4184/GphlegSOOS_G2810.1